MLQRAVLILIVNNINAVVSRETTEPAKVRFRLDADFDHFCAELQTKLIPLQKDEKELLTIDKFKPFSIIRSN